MLAEWWDLRDLGNAVTALLDWLDDTAPGWLVYLLEGLIGSAAILTFAGLTVILMIWVERKVIGRMQVRRGPNRAGPAGLLQPVADAIKLIQKEVLVPRLGDRWVFLAAPIVIFIPALISFAVIPFGPGMVLADLNVGALYFIAVGSTTTIAVWMAGWASNNKYSLLGSMRAVAMMVSYEIPLVISLLAVVVLTGSMSLGDIVRWQQEHHVLTIFMVPLAAFIFLFASSAELNRTPADIAEAESEIVAGYHTEYSGMKFGLFYAMELAHTLAVSGMIATLFLGGWWLYGLDRWVPPWMIFIGKLLAVDFVFIWLRGTLPRLRIDHLMAFGWKFLLPIGGLMVMGVALEVLLWQEYDLRDQLAIPLFALVNGAATAMLIVGWTRVVGYRPARLPRRALLVDQVGGLPVTAER